MDLHVNKLTAAINTLSSATPINLSKDGQDKPICEKPKYSDNSGFAEVDEATTHEDDRTLYQEQREITSKVFIETSSENDPIFSAAIKNFSGSYNVYDEKWEQAVADDLQSAVMLAFNEAISEEHLKKLLSRTNWPDNCKPAHTKVQSERKYLEQNGEIQ